MGTFSLSNSHPLLITLETQGTRTFPFLYYTCRYTPPIATHCDICGINALDGQAFAQERLPFRRAKNYCPNCHRRFYERAYIILTAAIFLMVLVGLGTSYKRGNLQLANIPIILLVLLLQYPLTIAHEAGHAFFARLYGFHPIRVLIGSGKPLFHFNAFNVTWIFNRIPMMGLCSATPRTFVRRQWILFGAGGLIVNALLLLAAWIALRANAPIPQNILHALLWANALVIAENILPYTAPTPFGPLATDGKLLYHAIFHWNKPPQPARPPSKPATFALRILKCLAALFVFCCGLVFLLLAALFFTDKTIQADLLVRLPLTIFFALLGCLLLWFVWRILKMPVRAGEQKGIRYAPLQSLRAASTVSPDDLEIIHNQIGAADYSSALENLTRVLQDHPKDLLLLWIHTILLRALNQPTAAEASFDRFLAQITSTEPPLPNQSELYSVVLAEKLSTIMLQNNGRFQTECTAALQTLVTNAARITLLDQLACIPIIHEKPELYDSAEFCIRHALELAPRMPTLHGTLGALLAERGQYTEAKPCLRTCYNESDTPADRGITSYYLALLAAHQDDPATARRLAQQSIALHPEPWLTKKAQTLLARLKV